MGKIGEGEFKMIRALYVEGEYTGGCYVDPGEDDPVAWMTPSQLFDYAVRSGADEQHFDKDALQFHFFTKKPGQDPVPYEFFGHPKETVDGPSILFCLSPRLDARKGEVRVPGKDIPEIGVGEDMILKHAKYHTSRKKIDSKEVWIVQGVLVSGVKEQDPEEFMGFNLWMEEKHKKIAGRFLVGFGGDLASGLHDAFPEKDDGKERRSARPDLGTEENPR